MGTFGGTRRQRTALGVVLLAVLGAWLGHGVEALRVYTFHIKGAIKGTPVDETVTASDKTFNTVQEANAVEFPNKVPSAAELATKVDKQTPRIDAVQASAKQGSNASQDDANHALAVAIVALVVAVIVGFVSLTRSRQAKHEE
jgi:hypothetical protein